MPTGIRLIELAIQRIFVDTHGYANEMYFAMHAELKVASIAK